MDIYMTKGGCIPNETDLFVAKKYSKDYCITTKKLKKGKRIVRKITKHSIIILMPTKNGEDIINMIADFIQTIKN